MSFVFIWNKENEVKHIISSFPRGEVLKLFFDGVCGPRSETLIHI